MFVKSDTGFDGPCIQVDSSASLRDRSGNPLALVAAWADITGKPATFDPGPHTHAINEITGLGTGVAAALAIAVGAVGGPVVQGGDIGAATGTSLALSGALTANGNVTITTADQYTGNLLVQSPSSPSRDYIKLITNAYEQYIDGGGANSSLTFRLNGGLSQVMKFVSGTNNVLIGSATDNGAKLQVTGDAKLSGSLYANNIYPYSGQLVTINTGTGYSLRWDNNGLYSNGYAQPLGTVGNPWGAVTAGQYNGMVVDRGLSATRIRLMESSARGIDVQSNSDPLFRVSYQGSTFPLVVNSTGVDVTGALTASGLIRSTGTSTVNGFELYSTTYSLLSKWFIDGSGTTQLQIQNGTYNAISTAGYDTTVRGNGTYINTGNGTVSLGSQNIERMRIVNGGRILMGSTLPTDDTTSALQVNGNLTASGTVKVGSATEYTQIEHLGVSGTYIGSMQTGGTKRSTVIHGSNLNFNCGTTGYGTTALQLDGSGNATFNSTGTHTFGTTNTVTMAAGALSASGTVTASGFKSLNWTLGYNGAEAGGSISLHNSVLGATALTINQQGWTTLRDNLYINSPSMGEAGIILQQAGVGKWQLYDAAGLLRLYNYTTATQVLSVAAATGNITASGTGTHTFGTTNVVSMGSVNAGSLEAVSVFNLKQLNGSNNLVQLNANGVAVRNTSYIGWGSSASEAGGTTSASLTQSGGVVSVNTTTAANALGSIACKDATFANAAYPLGTVKIMQADNTGSFAGTNTGQGIRFTYYLTGADVGAIFADNSASVRFQGAGGGYVMPGHGVQLMCGLNSYGVEVFAGNPGLVVKNRAGSAEGPVSCLSVTNPSAALSVSGVNSVNLQTGGTTRLQVTSSNTVQGASDNLISLGTSSVRFANLHTVGLRSVSQNWVSYGGAGADTTFDGNNLTVNYATLTIANTWGSVDVNGQTGVSLKSVGTTHLFCNGGTSTFTGNVTASGPVNTGTLLLMGDTSVRSFGIRAYGDSGTNRYTAIGLNTVEAGGVYDSTKQGGGISLDDRTGIYPVRLMYKPTGTSSTSTAMGIDATGNAFFSGNVTASGLIKTGATGFDGKVELGRNSDGATVGNIGIASGSLDINTGSRNAAHILINSSFAGGGSNGHVILNNVVGTGNVLIGSATDNGAKLQVTGNVTASGTILATAANNSGRIEVRNGSVGNLILLGDGTTGNVTINNANTVGGAIDFQSRGLSRLNISSTGMTITTPQGHNAATYTGSAGGVSSSFTIGNSCTAQWNTASNSMFNIYDGTNYIFSGYNNGTDVRVGLVSPSTSGVSCTVGTVAASTVTMRLKQFATTPGNFLECLTSAAANVFSIGSAGKVTLPADIWSVASGGVDRLYFENAGANNYYKANAHTFRNVADTTIATISSTGQVSALGFAATGTSSSSSVEVRGAAGVGSLYFYPGGVSVTGQLYNPSDGNFTFRNGANTVNGNLTIGALTCSAFNFAAGATIVYTSGSGGVQQERYNGDWTIQRDVNGIRLGVNASIGFTGANAYDAVRTRLQESSAGVLEINNGTTGTFRDLQVRNAVASGEYQTTGATVGINNWWRMYSEDVPGGKLFINSRNSGLGIFINNTGMLYANSIGIGITTPVQPLDIFGGSGDGTTNEAYGLRIRGTNVTGNSATLQMGANGTTYAYMQSAYWGGGLLPLYMNPKGAQVFINASTTATTASSPVSLISGRDVLIKGPFSAFNSALGRLGFSADGAYGSGGKFPAYIGAYADNNAWTAGVALTFNTISGADVSGSDGIERMRISSAGVVTAQNGIQSVVNGFSAGGNAPLPVGTAALRTGNDFRIVDTGTLDFNNAGTLGLRLNSSGHLFVGGSTSDYFSNISAGTQQWQTAYSGVFNFRSNQSGQSMSLLAVTAEGKTGGLVHWDVAHANGRRLDLSSAPGVPITIRPANTLAATFDASGAVSFTNNTTMTGIIASTSTFQITRANSSAAIELVGGPAILRVDTGVTASGGTFTASGGAIINAGTPDVTLAVNGRLVETTSAFTVSRHATNGGALIFGAGIAGGLGGTMMGAWTIGAGGSLTIATGSTGNDMLRLNNTTAVQEYYLGATSSGTFIIRNGTAGATRFTMAANGDITLNSGLIFDSYTSQSRIFASSTLRYQSNNTTLQHLFSNQSGAALTGTVMQIDCGSGTMTAGTKLLSLLGDTALQAMTVLTSGRVGFGTATPGSRVELYDAAAIPELRVNVGVSTNSGRITFYEGVTSAGQIQYIGSGFSTVSRRGDIEILAGTGGKIVFSGAFPSYVYPSYGNLGVVTDPAVVPGRKLRIGRASDTLNGIEIVANSTQWVMDHRGSASSPANTFWLTSPTGNSTAFKDNGDITAVGTIAAASMSVANTFSLGDSVAGNGSMQLWDTDNGLYIPAYVSASVLTISAPIDVHAVTATTANFNSVDVTGLANFYGGVRTNMVTKTSNYTLATSNYYIRADATTATFTLTLPTAVSAEGQTYRIKKINSANSVIIATTAAQTIDGASTLTLTAQYSSVTLVSNGTNWDVL